MYGIVNKAIEDLVVANFGQEKWEIIKTKSNIDVDYFISNEPYNDDITYKLAIAVSEEMGMSIADVLTAFGEWWILKTGQEKYGPLLSSGGDSLGAFMLHLPDFHTRIIQMYPKLTPPEFKISDLTERSLHVHYFSQRPGLQEFVRGLLQGLSKLYKTPVTIELLQTRDNGSSHEIFKMSWE